MKMMVNRLSRTFHNQSLGLLLIRLAAGAVFFMHGWSKIHNFAGVTGMMQHLGVFAPGFMGPFVAWVEVIGGLMLILGIVTRVAAVALAIDMIAAIFLTGIGRGWGPHELEIVLLAASLGIALTGSGKYAVYKMECKNCLGMVCDGKDCGQLAK